MGSLVNLTQDLFMCQKMRKTCSGASRFKVKEGQRFDSLNVKKL